MSEKTEILDLTPRLASVTRQLLLNRPRTLKIDLISASTGISKSWLSKFASAKSDNPSVNKVERLYIFLSQQPLQLVSTNNNSK